MSDYYTKAKELACRLGYTKFTNLQNKAFTYEKIFSDNAPWIFVIGDTSSGKTLIPLICYFLQYLEGKQPHMLFAVPYRALAAQKHREITSIVEKLELNLKIEVSTGELRSADEDIRFGNVDIAVIIYEKVFMFASMDEDFLGNYELLVMDEIGLTQDIARGLKADFIMARTKMYKDLKVVALGTPYYDWSLYLKSFNFICIREDKRPIKLRTFPIYVAGKKERRIDHIDEECYAVTCGPLFRYKNRQDDPNPRQWWDKIIEDICIYHLRSGHKILVFINNREEVHKLSQRLCSTLARQGNLKRWIEEDKVSKYIFDKMQLEEEDAEGDLYGVFDKNDYEAFAYGVSYHNAMLPNAVRTLVEEEVLMSSGHLQIVCCTETLAYGINSNVDVVVIPDMIKQRPGEIPSSTFLRANEYMNYAGRAGRLTPESTEEQVGYVYPIIRAEYENQEGQEDNNQHLAWMHLCREIEKPDSIFSRYFNAENVEKPFYLLSLFPNSKSGKKKISITQIAQMIKSLPVSLEYKFDQQKDVISPLNFLSEKKLICRADSDEDFDDEEDDNYYLTDTGILLTGFIIRQDDFENLLSAIEKGVSLQNIWIGDFFYAILNGVEIRREISNSIGNLYKMDVVKFEEMMVGIAKQLWTERDKLSVKMKNQAKQILGIDLTKEKFDSTELQARKTDNRCNFLRITAALLFWISPHCTVKKMYNRFGIGYPQMQKLAEQISYHLDIAKFSISVIRTQEGKTMTMLLGRNRIQDIQEQIANLSKAVYFQISLEMCKVLKLEVMDPVSALKARRVIRDYISLTNLTKKVQNGRKLSKKESKYVQKSRERIGELSDSQRTAFDSFWEVL